MLEQLGREPQLELRQRVMTVLKLINVSVEFLTISNAFHSCC
jgi:hypothetical protein